MALTPEDIQAIREALKPEFEHINQRFEQIDQRFTRMDQRFDALEATLTAAWREIVGDIYGSHPTREEFESLQTRVRNLENKLLRHGS